MILEGFRICTKCGKIMSEGFLDEGDYYCSDTCLPYSELEWNDLYEEFPNDCYWTQWEPTDIENQIFDYAILISVEILEHDRNNDFMAYFKENYIETPNELSDLVEHLRTFIENEKAYAPDNLTFLISLVDGLEESIKLGDQ